jgi:hypothetical protein
MTMPQSEGEHNEDGTKQAAPLFTVFTATFNRADTLHRAFESLQSQTFRDFEWLIIDDGSSDQTPSLVEAWQKTADFPIRYSWQPNQGKHIAFNAGVRDAHGEMLMVLDSDDACLPYALERFAFHWRRLPEDQRHLFCGVMSHCTDVQGNLVGDRFPQDVMDGNFAEILFKHKVRGEKWWILRTDVLKQFPFPSEGSPKYIPESIIWRKIAQRYTWRFINEALRIYYEGQDGRPDQLTRAPLAGIAMGCAMDNQSRLNEEIRWSRHAPLDFLRAAALYSRFSFHVGTGLKAQVGGLHNPLARILWTIGLPIGYLSYRHDARGLRRRSNE